MTERLTTFFNKLHAEWQKRSDIKAGRKAALKAIAASDPDSLGRALGGIRSSELGREQQEELLKAAIDKGDVKTFNALLAFTGDPNATITEATGGIRVVVYHHLPLLDYALLVRSHDVALALANDSRTDVRKLTNPPSTGMVDVAAVLARRTADLLRQDAAKWDKVAEELAPTAKPL